MKKNIQLFVVFVLVMAIIGVARNNTAWASTQPSGVAQPLSEIVITESGSYTVGGLCQFNVVYTGSGASVKAAVDVPAEDSRKIPYNYEDRLYLAGCHIVHSVMDKITSEMSPTYGSWEICFGDRPDEELTIYYYPDNPKTGSAIWTPLVTTAKNGFACAPANYTGVYAPGGRRLNVEPTPFAGETSVSQQDNYSGGTVRPESPVSTDKITKSGTYNVGGVCSIIVDYYVPDLSNEVHVEENTEVAANVPFPDSEGLLYLPGCHVFHFKQDKMVTDVTTKEGSWKICFAAIPNKQTTIYFYYADDDTPEGVRSNWAPLETTLEGGMACAPLTDYTGVYTPTGK